MRLRDVMTADPLVVGSDISPEAARRIMDEGRVHHLPIIENGRLVGMWVATDAGPLVVLGPDRVHTASPDDNAVDAVAAVMDHEAVLAMSQGTPVGILTRADAVALVRAGLDAGRPSRLPPLVIRLVGPAQSGKTTLLLRTIAGLKRCRVGVIEANPQPPDRRLPSHVAGATVTYEPAAHWRKGFRDAIDEMGGAEVIIVEDRDQPAEASLGLGEDVQVIVVPAGDAGTVHTRTLVDAQAVVLTKPDLAPGFDEAGERARLLAANPKLAVFVVGLADDDEGLRLWQDWVDARLQRHRR